MEKHPKWGIQLPSPQPGASPQPWDGPSLFPPSPHCSLHTGPCNHHTGLTQPFLPLSASSWKSSTSAGPAPVGPEGTVRGPLLQCELGRMEGPAGKDPQAGPTYLGT